MLDVLGSVTGRGRLCSSSSRVQTSSADLPASNSVGTGAVQGVKLTGREAGHLTESSVEVREK
jgi:hypothetical protein